MTMQVSFDGKSWSVVPHVAMAPGDKLSISVTTSPANFIGVAYTVHVLVNGLDPSGPHEENLLDKL